MPNAGISHLLQIKILDTIPIVTVKSKFMQQESDQRALFVFSRSSCSKRLSVSRFRRGVHTSETAKNNLLTGPAETGLFTAQR